MTDVRNLAIRGVREIIDEDGYSQLVVSRLISDHPELPEQDRKLLTRLVYETVLHGFSIDRIISSYTDLPLKKMKPEIRNALRIGICQLAYLQGIRSYAAVSSTVEAVKKTRARSLAGFVNGVLRHIERDLEKKFLVPDSTVELPRWLMEKLEASCPKGKAEELSKIFSLPKPVCIRMDAPEEQKKEILESLKNQIGLKQGRLVPDAWYVSSGAELLQHPAFARGLLSIQDESSMAAAEALVEGLRRHLPADSADRPVRILDMCAAPGGKSTYMALRGPERLGRDVQLISRDIHPSRVGLMENYVRRLGITNMTCAAKDALAADPQDTAAYEGILLDAPCSGIGIVRSKPDILLKRTPEEIGELTDIQQRMLDNAASMLKAGGVLVYSTCTLLKEENEGQILAFLQRHPEFEEQDLQQYFPEDAGSFNRHLTLWPEENGHDGFFIALLTKKKQD